MVSSYEYLLYKHYANKQDIFDSILRRMEADDLERSKSFDVPEEHICTTLEL